MMWRRAWFIPRCGYCLEASMTAARSVPVLWIPAYAGVTGWGGNGGEGSVVWFCETQWRRELRKAAPLVCFLHAATWNLRADRPIATDF